MTEQTTSDTAKSAGRRPPFSLKAWVLANAIGLGVAYGLFALLGDLAEYGLGVTHDSLVRNIALIVAVAVGATLFVVLRQRVLALHIDHPTRVAVGAGVGLAIGLIVGFAVGGPPFDFILGVIGLGTIGGGLQWRALRDHVRNPGRLLMASIGGWVLAGVAAGATAVLAGDSLHRLFGAPDDGTTMGTIFFVFILALLGVVGGTVGGMIEGRALRNRLT